MYNTSLKATIAARQGKADYQQLQSWAESQFTKGTRAHSMIGAFVTLVMNGTIDLDTAKQNLIRIASQQ